MPLSIHIRCSIQAECVARNVRAVLRGEKAEPFRYAPLGEMLALGGSDASISALGMLQMEGSFAGHSRRAVYAARMPTPRQKARAGLGWAAGAVFDAVQTITRPFASLKKHPNS